MFTQSEVDGSAISPFGQVETQVHIKTPDVVLAPL